MSIAISVDSYRRYLESQTAFELRRRVTEAEESGRRYMAALIREILAAKDPTAADANS